MAAPRLRREALADLTPGELRAVAGGEITVTCWCIVQIVVREVVEKVRETTLTCP